MEKKNKKESNNYESDIDMVKGVLELKEEYLKLRPKMLWSFLSLLICTVAMFVITLIYYSTGSVNGVVVNIGRISGFFFIISIYILTKNSSRFTKISDHLKEMKHINDTELVLDDKDSFVYGKFVTIYGMLKHILGEDCGKQKLDYIKNKMWPVFVDYQTNKEEHENNFKIEKERASDIITAFSQKPDEKESDWIIDDTVLENKRRMALGVSLCKLGRSLYMSAQNDWKTDVVINKRGALLFDIKEDGESEDLVNVDVFLKVLNDNEYAFMFDLEAGDIEKTLLDVEKSILAIEEILKSAEGISEDNMEVFFEHIDKKRIN